MSILELIARRSSIDPASFSLPDLLAEEAMTHVRRPAPEAGRSKISEVLAAELVREDPKVARRHVQSLLDHGVCEARLFDTYLAGAATALGACWEEDTLNFAQVTHAMGNLMEIARETMSPPPTQARLRPARPRVFLARTPGEDHIFGLILVAQKMRRRGWLVRVDLSGDVAALTAAFQAQRFDIVGFTASGHRCLPALQSSIAVTRRRQGDARVVLGGLMGDGDPDFAARMEADLALGRDTSPVERMISHFELEDA